MACKVVRGHTESSELELALDRTFPLPQIFPPVNEYVNQPVNRLNTIGGANE